MLNRLSRQRQHWLSLFGMLLVGLTDSTSQGPAASSPGTPVPTRAPVPTGISFTANSVNAASNQRVTMIATTNAPVDNTGYFIEIANISNHTSKQQCSAGSSCSVQLANSGAQATYQAFVTDGSTAILSSDSVTVSWADPPPTPPPPPPSPTPKPYPNVAGNYSGSYTSSGGDYSIVLQLQQSGSTVTGTTIEGLSANDVGTVDSTGYLSLTEQFTNGAVAYLHGNLSGDTLSGTWFYGDTSYGGTWQASR